MINYNATADEMGPEEIKEANRFMWAVNGIMIPDGYSKTSINKIFKDYQEKLWGICCYSQFEGFDDAWEHYCQENFRATPTKNDWHKWRNT
tara:strand:- start:603 stop:875 length:273 start_codon:yes stop_codon:yes gene_type:complete